MKTCTLHGLPHGPEQRVKTAPTRCCHMVPEDTREDLHLQGLPHGAVKACEDLHLYGLQDGAQEAGGRPARYTVCHMVPEDRAQDLHSRSRRRM